MKSDQDKDKGLFSWHFVVWPALAGVILGGLFYWLDKRDPAMMVNPEWPHNYRAPSHIPTPGNPLEWAPVAWGIIAAGIIYIVGCCVLYRHAKRYNRNAVRWTTAAIVFSPALAWIVYGLSWRKSL